MASRTKKLKKTTSSSEGLVKGKKVTSSSEELPKKKKELTKGKRGSSSSEELPKKKKELTKGKRGTSSSEELPKKKKELTKGKRGTSSSEELPKKKKGLTKGTSSSEELPKKKKGLTKGKKGSSSGEKIPKIKKIAKKELVKRTLSREGIPKKKKDPPKAKKRSTSSEEEVKLHVPTEPKERLDKIPQVLIDKIATYLKIDDMSQMAAVSIALDQLMTFVPLELYDHPMSMKQFEQYFGEAADRDFRPRIVSLTLTDIKTSLSSLKPYLPALRRLQLHYFSSRLVEVREPRRANIDLLAKCLKLEELALNLNGYITDFTPLIHCPKLTALSLTRYTPNREDNVAKLGACSNLKRLTLAHSESNELLNILPQIEAVTIEEDKNIRSLPPLNKLRTLALHNCNLLTDITGIAGNTNLTVLSISNTRVKDITPVATCINLRSFDLNNYSAYFDTTLFANLKHLHTLSLKRVFLNEDASFEAYTALRELSLSGLSFSNNRLPNLPQSNGLKILRVESSPIEDLTVVANSAELTSLTLIDCSNLEKVDFIRACSKLEKLHLDYASPEEEEVNFLTGHKLLTELYMSDSGQIDNKFLKTYPALVKLTLIDMKVVDLKDISSCVQLEQLDIRGDELDGMGIFHLKEIAKLPHLTKLKLVNIRTDLPSFEEKFPLLEVELVHPTNQQITCLGTCKRIQKLDISNKLELQLELLGTMPNLTTLTLKEIGHIPSLKPLIPFPGLRHLTLHHCSIFNPVRLVPLLDCPTLQSVDLTESGTIPKDLLTFLDRAPTTLRIIPPND